MTSSSRTPVRTRPSALAWSGLGGLLLMNACSIYTDDLLAQADDASDESASVGGSSTGGAPASGGGPSVGGTGSASGGTGTSGAGGENSGGGSSGGQSGMGGEPVVDELCRIEPLVDPSSLPLCLEVGHPGPSDGDPCAAGDDCSDAPCGFSGLGTKTCTCKADGTFNCTCSRPESYGGRCPNDVEECTELTMCVRGPSCFDYDLSNVGAMQGTRAALHGDYCETEWDQCVTVDNPASDGCVCMKVSSSLPQWVCKDREGWFEPI